MRLTLHSDLAFRMLLFLATAGEDGADIPKIAEAYGVSENHLRKVATHLSQIGLVESTRGRGGGLRLGVDPSTVTIGAILRATESDFALVDCLGNEPQRCAITGSCGLQKIFAEALEAWFKILDRYTLADATEKSRSLSRLLGIL
jgi:Rrf2 family nitric oxide-sensitive transcriptional repressor